MQRIRVNEENKNVFPIKEDVFIFVMQIPGSTIIFTL